MSNAPRHKPQKLRYSWLLLSACLLTLVYVLSGPGQLTRFNGAIQDASSWLHQRPASPDIVIVAIDDHSIEAIGRWPWRRALHAAAIERISEGQPRAIGMDIVFSEEDLDYPGDDMLLQRALQKNGRTVLPVSRSAQIQVQPPLPSLRNAAAALGHTQMPVDEDGVVRRFNAMEGPKDALQWHMALSLHCMGQTSIPCTAPSAPCGCCNQSMAAVAATDFGLCGCATAVRPSKPLPIHHLFLYRRAARQCSCSHFSRQICADRCHSDRFG